MKIIFLVLFIFVYKIVEAQVSDGEKLFIKNCLTCHTAGGYAEQFDFSIKSRLFPIKKQLIESITSLRMPPGQYVVNSECPSLDSNMSNLSENDRSQIVRWIKTINENDQTIINLNKFNIRASSSAAIEDEIKKRKLETVVITQNDLEYSHGNKSIFDITSFYNLKKQLSNSENSVAGIEIEPTSSKSLHHVVFAYQDVNLGSIIPWSKFKKINLLPEGTEVSLKNFEPINVMVHRFYKSTLSNDEVNKIKITLYLNKKKSNVDYQIVNFPPSINFKLFGIYAESLSYEFVQTLKRPYYIKMIDPHMHATGLELIVEKISENRIIRDSCIGHFYGNEQGLGRYKFKQPVLINKNEKLKITCKYKNTGMPIKIGWGISDEMCTIMLYSAYTE